MDILSVDYIMEEMRKIATNSAKISEDIQSVKEVALTQKDNFQKLVKKAAQKKKKAIAKCQLGFLYESIYNDAPIATNAAEARDKLNLGLPLNEKETKLLLKDIEQKKACIVQNVIS